MLKVFFLYLRKHILSMTFKSIISLFVFLFLFSCTSEQKNIVSENLEKQLFIDYTISNYQKNVVAKKIDSVFSKYQFNGSAAVINEAEVLYQKSNGFEDFRSKSKLDSNSVFAIASVSKQFTAVLVLLKEEEQLLSTDHKVSQYLAEFQSKQFENITIAQLLNHTSGLSDFGNGLLSKPRTQFNYSNKGYYFLGQIIEKVSGKSLDDNLLELFKTVGMAKSSTANIFQGNHFAAAYTGTSTKFNLIENMPKRLANKDISVPAGGILSTINDLNLWNQALYNGRILNAESLAKFSQKSADRNHQILGKMDYGFGIMMNVEKPQAYFHTGYVKGSPSLNIYYPETKTSVIILSNIANEALGKSAVFQPHKRIKKITDEVQSTVIKLRKEMSK